MNNTSYRMEDIVPLMCEVLKSGGEFRLFPRGTSMLPLLREGKDSVVLIAPRALRRRAVYLYRRADGAFVLHRCMAIAKDGTLTFCGDNQLFLESDVPPEAIIAEMSAFYRGEKRREVTNFFYRVWVRLHGIFFFRRVRSFCRRIFRKK